MAEYIVIDKEGKELRRLPKGRGRTMAGAVPNVDGNWVVSEANLKTETQPAVTPLETEAVKAMPELSIVTEDDLKEVIPTEKPPFKMNTSEAWIREKAELEGNGIVSVGGLMHDLDPTGEERKKAQEALMATWAAEKEDDEDKPKKGSKNIKSDKQVTVKWLIERVLHRNLVVTPATITIPCPCLQIQTFDIKGWEQHYSNYSKFEIDRASRSLNVWVMKLDGQPDLTITGLFSDDGSEI